MKRDVENVNTADYRAGLVEQITRDMQTLGQLRILGYVVHPGETFYLDRIEAYQWALAEWDAETRLQTSDRGRGEIARIEYKPGEWHRSGKAYLFDKSDDFPRAEITIESNGDDLKHSAAIIVHGDTSGQAERRANIVAAAMELLQACQIASWHLPSGSALRLVDAAIAKALRTD